MNTLAKIKEAGQDYEWYPTTSEILEVISKDLIRDSGTGHTSVSILDIGAGNGSALCLLKDMTCGKRNLSVKIYRDSNETRGFDQNIDFEMFAIEKSQILINNMPEDIFVIGTEFHTQSFIDKKHDVYFCNPPYSEFVVWVNKLIRESNCKKLYLVIPDRWSNDPTIKESLSLRSAKTKVLGNFSFIDSEYRKARATVDILKIDYEQKSYGNSSLKIDPFDLWFDTHFKIKAEQTKSFCSSTSKRSRSEKFKALVDKKTLIKNLVGYYSDDLEKLVSNYKAIENLDSVLMKELEINLDGLKAGLRGKIEGLKNLYWRELFDNLEAITNRLTEKSRKSMLDKLTSNTSVDFTESNILSVVVWSLKNANKYFDSQLVEVYWNITKAENVINYKSNHRIVEDGWRFNHRDDRHTHYVLDYRIINSCYNAVSGGYIYEHDNGLNRTVHSKISDIFTVAKNLGFTVKGSSMDRQWEAGKKQEFYLESGEIFVEIKAFKNGNIHMKFNQDFMKKFNIEAGRLNGWIKSPKEAHEETGIPVCEAQEYFKSNIELTNNNVLLISD